ncbi:MAG: phosphopyruvate hydratase [Clostridia bacterium]
MKDYLGIQSVHALEVLDSRGNPTVQVEVVTEGGFSGVAIVPSGASTGSFEAVELRNTDDERYMGKGVSDAVDNVNTKIAKKLIGVNVYEQRYIDNLLIKLDGTPNKSVLGANAILGVSLACCKAASNSLGTCLYSYIGGVNAHILPTPMMNILNGGKHSDNNLSVQEFMIVPLGGKTFTEKLEMGATIYQNLKKILKSKNLSTAVGDEGGFAPNLQSTEEALDLIVEAIQKSNYKLFKDVGIALDVAATEMYDEARKQNKDGYLFWKTGEYKTKDEMINYLSDLCNKYPIISIEDGLAEEDWESWKTLTSTLGNKVQLVGDDLFVTNVERLKKGLTLNVANSILIKPNQIGTLTETLDAIELAKSNGYKVVISHRSGETEDTTIADIAVATNIGQIKSGAPCRTDRIAKYNRLLNIEDELLNN